MFNRSTRTALGSTQQAAIRSISWTVFVRDTINGFRKTAHHTLMVTGVIAISTLGILFINPHLTDHIKAFSPFTAEILQDAQAAPQLENLMAASAQPAAQASNAARSEDAPQPAVSQTKQQMITDEERKIVATHPEQQRVTSWLAKRYRVAGDATNMLVSAAYLTAKEIKLDPLLILAVMAIESRFNPFAESPVGAQGLMQVMSKVHHEKFQDLGGIKAALNPVANIKVGSLILKEYVRRGGSVEAGLKMYVGAAAFENDSGYGSKVLAEYRRLKDVASGKRVPAFSAVASRAVDKAREERTTVNADALSEAESASADKPV
jgi:soluble lytic murein transglycosylase-like protein